MNSLYTRLMNDAARLTRGGDLRGATVAIQAALAKAGAAPRSTPANAAGGGVIDVETRVVADEASRSWNAAAMRARIDQLCGAWRAPGVQARTGAPSDVGRVEPIGDAPSPRAPGTAVDRFITGRYANHSSARDYKLYVPPDAGKLALPLIVMLHGCTQDPDDFAAGTGMNDLARSRGSYVLYPAQCSGANPQRCWNWFKHSHQQRGRGEAGLLAEMTRDVIDKHTVDGSRVYVAGLSAGGAMAAVLGAAYPDLYAAVGVHSGLAAGSGRDLASALAAMKGGAAPSSLERTGTMPTIVFHGDADATVHPVNAEQVLAAGVGAAHSTVTTVELEPREAGGTRGCTRRIHRDADGHVIAEHWLVHGAPHAWSGGRAAGSYTDPQGPDATAEMMRFFSQHRGRGR